MQFVLVAQHKFGNELAKVLFTFSFLHFHRAMKKMLPRNLPKKTQLQLLNLKINIILLKVNKQPHAFRTGRTARVWDSPAKFAAKCR